MQRLPEMPKLRLFARRTELKARTFKPSLLNPLVLIFRAQRKLLEIDTRES
jgi:hypothetical protein